MKKLVGRVAFIILTVVIFVIKLMLLSVLIESALLPSDFLFYEHSAIFSYILAVLIIIPSMFLAYFTVYYVNKKLGLQDDFLHFVWFSKALGKWKTVIIALWAIVLYIGFTSLTYVTSDSIVRVTPLNLNGKAYSYSDVEKIQTGFGNKRFSVYEYKIRGNFYYKITIDGKETAFHMPSANPNIARYEDTYLELEEFDRSLYELNIPKESSASGYEKCDFDKIYVDRFLRIIGLKNTK